MRDMELQMKHTTGEELTKLMEAYSRLTHEFELENGYAYKSELVGVLKGWDFLKKILKNRLPLFPVDKKPEFRPWQAAAL